MRELQCLKQIDRQLEKVLVFSFYSTDRQINMDELIFSNISYRMKVQLSRDTGRPCKQNMALDLLSWLPKQDMRVR